MRSAFLWFVSGAVLAGGPLQDVAGTVTAEQAARHLRVYSAPEYPAIAATARVAGIIVIEIDIGADGAVRPQRVLSGSALLKDAAVDAVTKWRYEPFLANGVAVPVRSTVRVPFILPSGNALATDPDIWVLPFYDEGIRCEAAVNARDLKEAERRCLSMVAIVDRLPGTRVAERYHAMRAGAAALMLLERPKDALPLLDRATRYAEDAFGKKDAAVGLAWFDVAKAHDALKNPMAAAEAYTKADAILKGVPVSAEVRAMLATYLDFLTRSGQIQEAQKVRDRLDKMSGGGE